MYSTKPYESVAFGRANAVSGHEIVELEDRLRLPTVPLAEGAQAVCVFVNDVLDDAALTALAAVGVRHVALRCAGFNNVDLVAAERLGLDVVRVPAYSPNAVAEHTIALILSLNRRIHKAYNRVRDGNFALDGLVGFDLAGKTVGVVGTGRIGALVARLAWHFRCEVVAHDPNVDQRLVELGIGYVGLDELWERSHVVTLNCPLTPDTHHLVSTDVIARMRAGVMLVNTGRGALIDTSAVIDGLKTGHIGSLALDVYEEEAELVLRGPLRRDHRRRRVRPAPDVPERVDHRPPGVPDARGARCHRRDHVGQPRPPRRRRDLREPPRLIA